MQGEKLNPEEKTSSLVTGPIASERVQLRGSLGPAPIGSLRVPSSPRVAVAPIASERVQLGPRLGAGTFASKRVQLPGPTLAPTPIVFVFHQAQDWELLR